MLYFISGKPGNGKTLYALATVHALQKSTGRPVFYFGIPLSDEGKAQLQWTELSDPTKWYDCPDGAIVVVDECQQHWRVRARSADVPKSIIELETHRHKGFDLFFLTQDPLLVDTNLRKLVWEHTHIKRSLGLERATLYRWKQRVASPDSKAEYKDTISSAWTYPKEYYGYYKSAELHTAKADIPWNKILIIGGIACLLIGALLYVFRTGWGDAPAQTEAHAGEPESTTHYGAAPQPLTNPWAADRWNPRVYGRAETAQAYDRIQTVRSQPSVKGCSMYTYDDGTVDCTCTATQGYKLDITPVQCVKYIKHGWFDPNKPQEDLKAINIAYLNSKDRAVASSPTQTPRPPQQEAQQPDPAVPAK